jgi:hypothetical protein
MLRVLKKIEGETCGRVRITGRRQDGDTTTLDFILADATGARMQGTRTFDTTTRFTDSVAFERELWSGHLDEVAPEGHLPEASLWWTVAVAAGASALSGVMAAVGMPMSSSPQTLAVSVVALIFGTRHALVLTFLMALVHNELVVPPLYTLDMPTPGEWAMFAFWTSSSLVMPWLAHNLAWVRQRVASAETLVNARFHNTQEALD